MNKQDVIGAYQCETAEGFDILAELALDLIWSWKHRTDIIWKQLDPELWDLTHNPWIVLQTVSKEKLERMFDEPQFRQTVEELVQAHRNEEQAPAWFQRHYSHSPLSCTAFFSMEFMLSEALPIYSGGLGNVAGDQLKSASDLGVPVAAIGLLYQRGYFRQVIDKDGVQQALYPYNDPMQLPITPLRKPNGEWLRLEIQMPGWSLWIRTWQVKVGRLRLYLLDSNDPANYPAHRGVTSELYGGGTELRLKQEMILGIGGWRLLEQLNLAPEVCHLNEGHAAFAILERAYCFMKASGQPFHIALEVTRAGNLFTTHTAVPAGFDRFPPALIEQYLKTYSEKKLKIPLKDLLALGRLNPNDPEEHFNMAYLAIRGSGAISGVSRLHGSVSKDLFARHFPRWPLKEIPVGYVTNGVHMPSWDSAAADNLWTKACGKERWLRNTDALENGIRKVSDAEIWQMRNDSRFQLIEFARQRLSRELAAAGVSLEQVEVAKNLFDPNTLTIGFARRFATYKRPNMLLHDPERLLRILTNDRLPVQLIIAGKAHPEDKPGQALIHEWIDFIRRHDIRAHAIFLSDYDMLLTEHLVQGVDVWLNTPRRPWEACGTSGMKILVNGGLNVSELDGWWAEAYKPEYGWALGDGKEHDSDPAQDDVEAKQLYDLLEGEIIPEFYYRDQEGMPTAWIGRIRNSMAGLTPRFSANRAVREYTELHYLPAAAKYKARMADKGALGKKIVDWQSSLQQNWSKLRFGEVKIKTEGDWHLFDVEIYLANLNPNAVKVELYADAYNNNPALREEMIPVKQLSGTSNMYRYQASVTSQRPAQNYVPRLVPYFSDVSVPLEAAQILWQR